MKFIVRGTLSNGKLYTVFEGEKALNNLSKKKKN